MNVIAISACIVLAVALSAVAGGKPDDVVAIQSAVPSVREIRATPAGYSIVTSSGTRNAYRTRTGYYIEGGPGEPSRQVIRTATGYRIESSATRGVAFGHR